MTVTVYPPKENQRRVDIEIEPSQRHKEGSIQQKETERLQSRNSIPAS